VIKRAVIAVILGALFLVSGFALGQNQDEIRKSIYFGGGSYDIDEIQIEELSNWLDSIPNLLDKYEIELISHTDPIGGKRFNEWLSKMRSEAVFDILINKSIPDQIIHIKDWNYDNPIYSNDSWEGRIMNRRVDVIVRPMVF
jgi:outer membrane protein OmpA-like peptidoglycan-associated protein